MVNRGRSAGCLTCKHRRVKCDEEKPDCRTCTRLRLRCEGYARPIKYARLKFKNENHRFALDTSQNVHPRRNGDVSMTFTGPSRSQAPRPVLLDVRSTLDLGRLSEPDNAVLFYLHNYARAGRDMASTRGFFEMLMPTYFAQPQGSALSLAVSALASEVLSMWRHDPGSFCTPRSAYTRAIKRLRVAIQDPIECVQPATALAALALQTYENASATFGLRWASSIHHCGAASLLSFLDAQGTDLTLRPYLRKFMLHTEVSKAIRQKRPLTDVAYSYLNDNGASSGPDNPSSALDAIGISVAELQSRWMNFQTQDSPMPPSEYVRWELELQNVDAKLLAWEKTVPDYWRPWTLVSGEGFDSSIPSFQSSCQVYPSCQIASIWNVWRFHRILLMKMRLSCFGFSLPGLRLDPTRQRVPDQAGDIVDSQLIIHDMIDSVCHSVPFHLGNRSTRSSLTDFTDPSILLPVDFVLEVGMPTDKCSPSSKISRADHRRHIIAQGPWRVMHPLSSLLTLFSEDNDNTITSVLRPGQREWISEQFSRVATILHIQNGPNSCLKRSEQLEERMNTDVEVLARATRKGTILMSGP